MPMQDSESSPETLAPRVTRLERDLGILAESVKTLANTVRDGFSRSSDAMDKSHRELQQEIRALVGKTDGIGKLNYQAVSVIVGVGSIALGISVGAAGTYVNSVAAPIREELKAERDARLNADARFQFERDELANQMSTMRDRVVSLETWEQARKAWKDAKP